MILIVLHLVAALFVLGIGSVQILGSKGTARHRALGWIWVAAMVLVTVPSFWIRELRDGSFSWIHGLTVWTLFCLVMAVWTIRRKRVWLHAYFMIGTLIGTLIAGAFALVPGRFISHLLGYG